MRDVVSEEVKPLVHHVRVGLAGGTVHELELEADAQLSVVISKIREVENLDSSSVRIRLIVAGKLHTDHSQLVRDIVPEGGFIHCAISEATPDESETQDGSQMSQNREVRIPLEAFDVGGEVRIVIPNLNSQVAFHRLLQAGFTANDIRTIRRHVRALRREVREQREEVRNGVAVTLAETPEEEQTDRVVRGAPNNLTVRRGHTNNLVAAGGDGTHGDFLTGCIFGFFLGIIILVLLLDNNATRRWRVGIIAGVATNCAFGVLRSNLYLHPSFPVP